MIEASPILPTPERRLEEARRRLPAFARVVSGVPYEAKGVLFSEILFLVSALGGFRPRRIVESGRARGQSTLLLALALPAVPIVSVERSGGTEDARIAEARLAPLANVELRYGDAFEELPAQVCEEDVVVIDGPKGWHALRLALELMRDRRPAAVFVHDCYRGQAERGFLEQRVPGTFFSDDPAFEALAADLDAPCFEAARRHGWESWAPHRFDGKDQESYGPTYACVPRTAGFDYGGPCRKLSVSRTASRIGRSLRKRLFGGGR